MLMWELNNTNGLGLGCLSFCLWMRQSSSHIIPPPPPQPPKYLIPLQGRLIVERCLISASQHRYHNHNHLHHHLSKMVRDRPPPPAVIAVSVPLQPSYAHNLHCRYVCNLISICELALAWVKVKGNYFKFCCSSQWLNYEDISRGNTKTPETKTNFLQLRLTCLRGNLRTFYFMYLC